jgi:BirA family biotin operon repressor/biotin-[acetyl-CoA-carboxylase] ligase
MDHQQKPELPSPYELIMLEETDSVLADAVRRAKAGAEEGTLLWAHSQSDAQTRRFAWDAPPGNLHCAIILRPDFDNQQAGQICAVATLAAGSAVAELVAPMTGMGVRWPGDLLINELLAGQIQLAAPASNEEPWPWLVIAVSINVAHHPENPEPEEFNSIHDSGDSKEVTPITVLEQFTRHFLRDINRWAEDGFEQVRQAWRLRARDIGQRRVLAFAEHNYEGVTRDLGEHGELLLDNGSDESPSVSIAEYFSLGAQGKP